MIQVPKIYKFLHLLQCKSYQDMEKIVVYLPSCRECTKRVEEADEDDVWSALRNDDVHVGRPDAIKSSNIGGHDTPDDCTAMLT